MPSVPLSVSAYSTEPVVTAPAARGPGSEQSGPEVGSGLPRGLTLSLTVLRAATSRIDEHQTIPVGAQRRFEAVDVACRQRLGAGGDEQCRVRVCGRGAGLVLVLGGGHLGALGAQGLDHGLGAVAGRRIEVQRSLGL